MVYRLFTTPKYYPIPFPSMNASLNRRDTSPLILIVDDDPGIRQILHREMKEQGYRILEAENGRQAIELYQYHCPDVVLLDVCMPTMDGFICCQEMIAFNQEQPAVILMITGLHDEASVTRAFDVGATDFITKPINLTILQHRVRRLIQQTNLMRQVRQDKLQLESDAELSNVTIREQAAQLYKSSELKSTLKRITDKVRDSLDESQILQTAVEELALALSLKCCNAGIYNDEQQTSQILYEYGASTSGYLGCMLGFADFPEVYQPLRNAKSVWLHRTLSSLVDEHVALFAFPIQSETVLGDLWLLIEDDRTLDALEIHLVEQVANQCAIGIRQARLYQTAQAQVQELERLNEMKDDFLSTVSHELRSPLATMRMAIQMLNQLLSQNSLQDNNSTLEPLDYARAATYLNILNTECEREITLINDLLDLQRLEAGNHVPQPMMVDVEDWFLEELEPFVIRAEARQQHLYFYPADNLPLLSIDPVCLRRILTELVSNACKYSPPGASIIVRVALENGELQLNVTNTGVEITERELARIFDRFYRITDGDRWKQGGTGLGLALVKKLVEHLGGAIQVSNGGDQVCFVVKIAANEIQPG